MAARRSTSSGGSESSPKRQRPATTPEAREHQLVALSYDLAEKQIRDGSASSQVISHFLKMGSSREFIEQERLRNEVHLTQAKIEIMQSEKRVEELYVKALDAMRNYAGQDTDNAEDDYVD